MSYLTPAEFRAVAFPSGSFDDIADSVVQHHLDAAASEIDGALGAFHTLPLTTTPHSVVEAEAVIAGFRLMLFTGVAPGSNEEPWLVRRYNDVVGDPSNASSGFLGQLRTGHIRFAPRPADRPAGSTPLVSAAGSSGWVQTLGGVMVIQ